MNEKLKYFVENKLSKIIDKYSEEKINKILDERDKAIFSNKWIEVYETLKNKCVKSDTNNIRRKVFSIVYDHSKNPELASYISDDFGLIHDALEINYNNSWVNALWTKYTEMEIPSGDISKIEGKLKDIINNS